MRITRFKRKWGRRALLLIGFSAIVLMAFNNSQPAPIDQHEGITYSKPGTGNSWMDSIVNIYLKIHNNMNNNAIGSFTSKTLMNDTLPNDYEELFNVLQTLSKQRWKRNTTSIQQFRQEFQNFHQKENLESRLIMNRDMVKPGDTVTCYRTFANLKITQEFWQMFSNHSIFNNTGRFKKCNIVGSSGILLNSKCGKRIDDGDLVIRFNLPSLKKFSEDVGQRSDYVTANPSIVSTRKSESYKRIHGNDSVEKVSLEHKGHAVIPAFDMDFNLPKVMQLYRLRAKQPCGQSYILNPEHTLAHRNFWLNAGMERRISSGFYYTSVALDLCEEIHLYGFWPFMISLDGTKVPYHYFDTLGPKLHNFDQEYRVLVRMHQLGLIKLQIGQCS